MHIRIGKGSRQKNFRGQDVNFMDFLKKHFKFQIYNYKAEMRSEILGYIPSGNSDQQIMQVCFRELSKGIHYLD